MSNIITEYDYQVGFKDESLPPEKELRMMSKGIKSHESSNWYNGRINNALKKKHISDRYKIIYIAPKGYYGFDKQNMTVIPFLNILQLVSDEAVIDDAIRYLLGSNVGK